MWLAWGLGLSARYTPNCLVEDALQVALCEGRALEVLLRLDLLGNHDCLLVLDGGHLLLAQRLLGGLVVSQIELRADEDDGHARRVMVDLGVPLVAVRWGKHGTAAVVGTHLRLDVVERRRADDGEADEEYVGLGVRKRPQSVVVFLSSGIPQSQADGLAVNHYIRRVVVEAGAGGVSSGVGARSTRQYSHSRDVLAGEGVRCVGDEETCLDR